MITETDQEQKHERIKAAAVVSIVFISAAVLFFLKPGQGGIFPPCPFHALTGLHCPGCGTLRGLHQLLHGNILGALDYNVFMVLALPFLAYPFLSNVSLLIRGKRFPRIFIPPQYIWALFYLILLYWALRNIPVYPFTILAP